MRTLGVWTLGVALIAGCSTAQVQTFRTPQNLQKAYVSWRWVNQADVARLNLEAAPGAGETVQVKSDQDLSSRVEKLAENQLKRRGFLRARELRPNFYVTFYAKAASGDWISSWHGTAPAVQNVPLVAFPDLDREMAKQHQDGTLYLTVIDGTSLKPVWTGRVSRTDYGSSFAQQPVSEAVRDLVDQIAEDLYIPISMRAYVMLGHR